MKVSFDSFDLIIITTLIGGFYTNNWIPFISLFILVIYSETVKK